MSEFKLSLSVLPEPFAFCKVKDSDQITDRALSSGFYSITRTQDGFSIICAQADVPYNTKHSPGWRCLKVEGLLDFHLTGVISSLIKPLAQVGIGARSMCTFNTDYLLVQEADLTRAILILRDAGHQISDYQDTR